MTRNLSLLTIPLAALLGLTLTAASADAGSRHGHGYKDNCEKRIFQGEDEACYSIDGRFVLFERSGADGPGDPNALRLPDLEEGDFTLAGQPCGCQLRRKNDLICGGNGALIGSVDRRGRTIRGEALVDGRKSELSRIAVPTEVLQATFTARRVALENCELQPEK